MTNGRNQSGNFVGQPHCGQLSAWIEIAFPQPRQVVRFGFDCVLVVPMMSQTTTAMIPIGVSTITPKTKMRIISGIPGIPKASI